MKKIVGKTISYALNATRLNGFPITKLHHPDRAEVTAGVHLAQYGMARPEPPSTAMA